MENDIQLSQSNISYLNRINPVQITTTPPIVQPTKEDDNKKKEKLTKTLVCLGAIGVAAVVGTMIYRGQFSKLDDVI